MSRVGLSPAEESRAGVMSEAARRRAMPRGTRIAYRPGGGMIDKGKIMQGYKKGDINNIIMNDYFSAFKVVYNNNIIAFVISQKMYNSRLHINSIAVNKKYRNPLIMAV